MFLWELESTLSHWLQQRILSRIGEDEKTSGEKWDQMIDVDLIFPINDKQLLKDIIERELIRKATGKTERDLRRNTLDHRRSALLFGPPGTSKTTIARGVAGKLRWPLLIITPSEFLSAGLEQIYARVTDVFLDLMDLSAVVVLFDEMDALAQTRGNAALDVTRQLLTTSMLPKLADLHDHGRVIFLMATNHRKDLDPAITRPGRFDLLLCVGPPAWARKIEGIGEALKGIETGKLDDLKKKLRELSAHAEKDLDFFTIGDLRSFAEYLIRRSGKKTLLEALNEMNPDKFKNDVQTWAQDYIALKEDRAHPQSSLRAEYGDDQSASRIQ